MSYRRSTPWYLIRGRPNRIHYYTRRCNIFNQNPLDNIYEFTEWHRTNNCNVEYSFDSRGRIRHISINRSSFNNGRIRRNWRRFRNYLN